MESCALRLALINESFKTMVFNNPRRIWSIPYGSTARPMLYINKPIGHFYIDSFGANFTIVCM